MGILLEKIKSFGGNIADNYKKNTLDFYNKYSKSSKEVLNIPVSKIQLGGFYFLHYQDDSNWMKHSPIFAVEVKKFNKEKILMAINFNFIPLEIRALIFDKYMTKNNFDDNALLDVSFEGVYNILKIYSLSYALVEYNLSQVKLVHKIEMSQVPQFLYSGSPVNKYDPIKLYSIMKKKLETAEKRDQEMMQLVLSDLYDISNDIKENYEVLKKHVERVKNSYTKYGK